MECLGKPIKTGLKQNFGAFQEKYFDFQCLENINSKNYARKGSKLFVAFLINVHFIIIVDVTEGNKCVGFVLKYFI